MTSFRFSALLVVFVFLTPLTAMAQRCVGTTLSDLVCDCGCGSLDPACPVGDFIVCAADHCPAGQVPWEHGPSQCMSSACGDGWNDPASGEVCDDGNALAGGGCSADCRSVTPGYVCGERAKGCHLAPADAGTSADGGTVRPDAGADAGSDVRADAGQADDAGTGAQADAGDSSPMPMGGCSTSASTVSLAALVAIVLLRRRVRSSGR